jgi:hypothetical protein
MKVSYQNKVTNARTVQRNNEARLCNHCCRVKATMRFLCMVTDLNEAVNYTELLSGDMDM